MACDILPIAAWHPALGLAGFIMVLIVAIIYMCAQLTGRVEWEAWARNEFNQIGISLFLVVNIYLFTSIACNISMFLTKEVTKDMKGEKDDPFEVSISYLENLVQKRGMPAVNSMIHLVMILQFQSSAVKTFGFPGATGSAFSLLKGYEVMAGHLELLITLFSPLVSSLIAQIVGLKVIQTFMFAIILPIGVILRIFPITRTAGVFLIAISIGFYVIMPLMYLLNAWWVYKMPSEANWGFGKTLALVGASEFIPHIIGARVVEGMFEEFMKSLAEIVPQAVFLPTLNMMVTITFIQSLFKFLNKTVG